ncbi:tyrosine-type recombinase/integrase [Thalassospira lohafexi]|uniref:Integrase n=1 Tax=Thalassospira lohafexi TaxID=744227 RepID=A0A2N3L3Q0_9PROT|nr:tyrosine-type recombinase/integrase [Thalassospira lohafexi]PKR57463.1 integrase [Thalassospira lohafexi]
MKINYPGLWAETLPSGQTRYRVRVEGNKARKIRLHVTPDHPRFDEHYRAARAGIQLEPESEPIDATVRGSLDWLVISFLNALERDVANGQASVLTLKQKRGLLMGLCDMRGDDGDRYGQYDMAIPQGRLILIRDQMRDTPAKANNMMKAVRVMFKWASERGMVAVNPGTGLTPLRERAIGAVPWTVEDLRKYREAHPPGTPAHLCLTLFMFTACRISDAVRLGRGNEFTRGGITGIGWQPQKKNARFVEIPMLPPLLNATRATTVQGQTYLLTEHGKPYRSPEGLRNRLHKWCESAGLENRSSHGIRKAAGALLAEEGCTVYEVMSIHGHASPKTSEIYTRGAERWKLAQSATARLAAMEW